ncbi:MAG: PEP-CTERM sorting domain-containing protein [Prosthecobacter sp.]|uniref:PEP-CTERM sorting domain-containing protein n=1 Tax=Prosthecobacter sp. TaxID=1965333 RepID=UPI0039028D40
MSYQSLVTMLAVLVLPFGTAKALNWNEMINGELSNVGNAPTFILFTEGSNLIEGTMGSLGGVGPLDADVWTFTIAAGYYLTGISLASYSAPTSGLDSFMAIDDATTINMSDPSQHLSNGLWTEELDGFGNTYTDLMAILDAGPMFGGTGFDGPIGPGDYTFWVQEGSEQIEYCINFVVTPVPEPGSALLLGLAGMLMLRRRR